MVSFLKHILKGILYVLFLPLGLIAIALYMVFGVGVFIFRLGKLIYLFFTGRNLKNELDEDIEVKRIIDANKPKEESNEPEMSLYPSDSSLYSTDYVSPTFNNVEKKEEPSSIEDQAEGEVHE